MSPTNLFVPLQFEISRVDCISIKERSLKSLKARKLIQKSPGGSNHHCRSVDRCRPYCKRENIFSFKVKYFEWQVMFETNPSAALDNAVKTIKTVGN